MDIDATNQLQPGYNQMHPGYHTQPGFNQMQYPTPTRQMPSNIQQQATTFAQPSLSARPQLGTPVPTSSRPAAEDDYDMDE